MNQNLTTPLCKTLGITIPIIQAPISAAPELIAAVSNAGGLGMIQATWHNADELVELIAEVRRLTDRPFGANFVLPLIEDQNYDNLFAALDAGVFIISTFWGDPAPVVKRIHQAGALALHTVASTDDAIHAVNVGVDILVAQGVEAGGHVWGQVGTIALVPSIVDAVPGTPVIAAGGIADGRGLASVLTLGAQAAWIGTRLLLAEEFDGHIDYKNTVIAAKETDTILTSLFDIGWPEAPHRCLINDTVDTWLKAGKPKTGIRPNEREIIAYDDERNPVPRYSSDGPKKGMTGQVTSLCMYAGQGVGMANDIQPAAQILEQMVSDASRILGNLVK